MKPMVPIGPHCDDMVECSDGSLIKRSEVWWDCRDNPHSNEADRHESNVAIVTEILDNHATGSEEYCRENEDFAYGYCCLVDEGHYNWPIADWIESTYGDIIKKEDIKDCINSVEIPESDDIIDDIISNINIKDIADRIKERLSSFDCEVIFNHNEYADYGGPGCCLAGFAISEQEEQICVTEIPELNNLHESGILDDVLDEYNGDAYISRYQRREKNPETGYYEPVGRETYDRGLDRPTFEYYHSPAGRWDFVVPEDTMEEYFKDSIVDFMEDRIPAR